VTCSACISLGKRPAHFATSRRCAFEGEAFSNDNWNCGTMNALREACVWSTRDDDQNACIGVVPLPGNTTQSGYIVLSWYKERGCTGQAIVMDDDQPPKPLTLAVAQLVTILAR